MCRSHGEGGRRCPADRAPKSDAFKQKDAARKRAERAAKRADLGVSASPTPTALLKAAADQYEAAQAAYDAAPPGEGADLWEQVNATRRARDSAQDAVWEAELGALRFDTETSPGTLAELSAQGTDSDTSKWLHLMHNLRRDRLDGEVEQWYTKHFKATDFRERSAFDFAVQPSMAYVRGQVLNDLKYAPDANTHPDVTPDAVFAEVQKRAFAATKRQAFGSNAGWVAGLAKDKLQDQMVRAVSIRESLSSAAKKRERDKANAPARKEASREDTTRAEELGISAASQEALRKVGASKLRKVSASSARYSEMFGKDDVALVTEVARESNVPVSLTTEQVTPGDLVWRYGKDQRGKSIRYSSRVTSVEPTGVYEGETFYRVTTEPAGSEGHAWLVEQDGYHQQNVRGY